MKQGIVVDHKNHQVIVSKAFYKRSSVYGTTEYCAMCEAMSNSPNYEIVFKVSEKKTYHGLTFKIMREYIETQANSDYQLKVFEAVIRVAEAKKSKYPLTKKWFLNTYPEYKLNEVKENETSDLISVSNTAENDIDTDVITVQAKAMADNFAA